MFIIIRFSLKFARKSLNEKYSVSIFKAILCQKDDKVTIL